MPKNKPVIDENEIINTARNLHIALIMDGNGRWAKKRGLPRTLGHQKGVKSLESVIDKACEIGVKIISVYAFSTENWSRPQKEVDDILALLRKYFKTQKQKMLKKNIRVMFMGDLSRLPDDLQQEAKELSKLTENCTGLIFNIGLNYGGRSEIVQAVNKALESGQTKLDEESIKKLLYTGDLADPDMIIRTGGDIRLSNFMLYQAAYSELFFIKKLWPDFKGRDLIEAIEEYNTRTRRFGKI